MGILLQANFLGDVRSHFARRLLERWRIETKPADSPSDVCARYFAVAHRLIEPRGRSVVWSRELRARKALLDSQTRLGLRAVEAELSGGNDVNPRLSTAYLRGKHDPFLNDLGVNHLHLGTALRPDGRFVERTGPLLFVLVRADAAYLLDVRPHEGAFDDDECLRLIERNWPELLDPYVVHGVSVDAEDRLDDGQRARLRRRGLNTLIRRADGSVIVPPGGGQMGSKLAVVARQAADGVLNRAASAGRSCASRIALIHGALRRIHPGYHGHLISLRFERPEDTTPTVTELQTGWALPAYLFADAQRWTMAPAGPARRWGVRALGASTD